MKQIKCKKCGCVEFIRYLTEKAYCCLEKDKDGLYDKDIEILEEDYQYECANCGASLNEDDV